MREFSAFHGGSSWPRVIESAHSQRRQRAVTNDHTRLIVEDNPMRRLDRRRSSSWIKIPCWGGRPLCRVRPMGTPCLADDDNASPNRRQLASVLCRLGTGHG
jgi:hypothetical protein